MHFTLFSFFLQNLLYGLGFLYFLLLAIAFYSLGNQESALLVLGAAALCLLALVLRLVRMRMHEIFLTQKAARGFLWVGFPLTLGFWFAAERCFSALTLGAGPLRLVFLLGLILSWIPLLFTWVDFQKLSTRETILKRGWLGPYNPKARQIRRSRRKERWRRMGR